MVEALQQTWQRLKWKTQLMEELKLINKQKGKMSNKLKLRVLQTATT